MAFSYNTSTKKLTVTTLSATRSLYDDIQTTFTGSAYMQFLNPMRGNIKDSLYILQNGWDFDNVTSVNNLYDGGIKDDTGNNIWTNVKTLSGDSFTGIQVYYNQTGTPTNFGATGSVNQLLKVRSSGTDIASQAYTVFQRTFQHVFSQFSTTASAGGIDTLPLSNSLDPLLTLSSGTLDGYTDLSLTWATIYRSAFDGVSTTNYTINGAHSNSVTTITVNESIDAGVPSSGMIAIGNVASQEVITYTGKGTNTFTGCTRATYGTTARSFSGNEKVSTQLAQYGIDCKTTNGARTLLQIYNWLQYQLTKATDIDSLTGGHIGKITNYLVSMPSATSFKALGGMWVEGYVATDANIIQLTDNSSVTHTPPASISVVINYDASVTTASGQVTVFALTTTGLTDATYTPANILSTLINIAASGTSSSTTMTYSADIPVLVIVRAAGLNEFRLYTSITNAGLNVTAQNPFDGSY